MGIGGQSMWHTERGAKILQMGVLLALGYVMSYDVERTMAQQPVSPQQTQQLQAWIDERRERR